MAKEEDIEKSKRDMHKHMMEQREKTRDIVLKMTTKYRDMESDLQVTIDTRKSQVESQENEMKRLKEEINQLTKDKEEMVAKKES